MYVMYWLSICYEFIKSLCLSPVTVRYCRLILSAYWVCVWLLFAMP